MKVLIPVLHYYPVIGGLEQWTQNIAERISEKAEIYVVTGRVSGQPDSEVRGQLRILRRSLFPLKDLSHSSLGYIFTALPFIWLQAFILIKKERINLLHCQGFLSGLTGYFLSKFTGVPYVVTCQNLEEQKSWLRKKVYREAKICIVASAAIKKIFEAMGVTRIEIVPNGLNFQGFESLNRQKSRENLSLKDEFAIMTVARLEKVKGIEYLIRAARLLENNCGLEARAYKLFIIGDGRERKNLESLAQQLDLSPRIAFLGAIENKNIPQYLAAADCFVLPSLKEGFGIVILEAMACLVPVVASRVGGILDLIEDQKKGLLVELRDPEALSQAIYKIYSQPELARGLVQNASAGLAEYDWQKIAEEVYQIYYQALK